MNKSRLFNWFASALLGFSLASGIAYAAELKVEINPFTNSPDALEGPTPAPEDDIPVYGMYVYVDLEGVTDQVTAQNWRFITTDEVSPILGAVGTDFDSEAQGGGVSVMTNDSYWLTSFDHDEEFQARKFLGFIDMPIAGIADQDINPFDSGLPDVDIRMENMEVVEMTLASSTLKPLGFEVGDVGIIHLVTTTEITFVGELAVGEDEVLGFGGRIQTDGTILPLELTWTPDPLPPPPPPPPDPPEQAYIDEFNLPANWTPAVGAPVNEVDVVFPEVLMPEDDYILRTEEDVDLSGNNGPTGGDSGRIRFYGGEVEIRNGAFVDMSGGDGATNEGGDGGDIIVDGGIFRLTTLSTMDMSEGTGTTDGTPGHFELLDGLLDLGDATVIGNGTNIWTSGTLRSSGIRLTVGVTPRLFDLTAGEMVLDQGTVINADRVLEIGENTLFQVGLARTLTVDGGLVDAQGSSINDGTIDIVSGTGMFNGMINRGQIDMLSGMASFDGFTNQGLVNVEMGTFNLDGETVNSGTININDGMVTGAGLVRNDGTINIRGGTVLLGSVDVLSSYYGVGTLNLGDADAMTSADVTLLSGAQTTLGANTTMTYGSTLTSLSGVTLATGSSLLTTGPDLNTIEGAFSQAIGTTVEAQSDLTLGDPNRPNGFFSDGVLNVNDNTVTILDENQAVLGALTTIGESTGGTLVAGNGLIVEFGKGIEGFGTITDASMGPPTATLLNNGSVINRASDPAPLEIDMNVKGVGDFFGGGTFIFNGTISPGLSPGITNVTGNLAFGASSNPEMEIVGPTSGTPIPGIDHDQINVSGTLTILAGATLDVCNFDISAQPLGSQFCPQSSPDNEYNPIQAEWIIMTAGGGIIGEFDTVNFPELGDWRIIYEANQIIVTTIPVPEPASYALIGSFLAIVAYKRRKVQVKKT